MRYDLIDLQGQLKVNGSTGSDKLGLGYSGSNVDWIESQLPGPTFSFLSNRGYNYVIVGATGSPTENAQNLVDINDLVTSLWIDGQDISNRFSVLLMPGDYDFATTTKELNPQNYVDYIGLSSNPYHTVFRNSLAGAVVKDLNGYDFGLENIYLPGDGFCYAIGSSYPRWKNIVFGGITFDLGLNPWPYVRGEYENIKIVGGADAFCADSEIIAKFTNIYGQNVGTLFRTNDSMVGTFSNITIDQLSGVSDSFSVVNGNISGLFENIIVRNASGNFFVADSIYGTFKNVRLENILSAFTFNTLLSGDFTDFEVKNVSDLFYSLSGGIEGKFENITISNLTHRSFYATDHMYIEINGLYLPIQSTGAEVIHSNLINGIFDNLNVSNCDFVFGAAIFGTFSNINVLSSDSFVSSGAVVSIKDSKFLGSGILLLNGSGIHTYEIENIEIENYSTVLSQMSDLYCNVNNVKMESISSLFSVGSLLSGTVSNLTVGNISNNFVSSTTNGDIEGRFFNLSVGNVGGDLFLGQLKCEVDGLIVGNVVGDAFCGTGVILNGKFRNIKIESCDNFFVNNSCDSPSNIFENIEVGTILTDCFVAAKIDGTYRNLKFGSVGNDLFYAYQVGITSEANLKGYYKEIFVGNCVRAFMVNNTNAQEINFFRLEDAFLGNCGKMMDTISVGTQSVLRNVRVFADEMAPSVFRANIENSYIKKDSPLSGILQLFPGAVVRRSTIISDQVKPFGAGSLGQVYLSQFNYTAGYSSPFSTIYHNIEDPSIQ